MREGLLAGGLPYLAFGRGPPLVVFPGFRAEHTTPSGPERRFHLQPLTPLAAHFTVYWVSPKPGLQPGSTIADLARHYAYALDGAFRGPVCILGVSTGGSIAQQFAIDHPQLVRRLVLTATACRLAPAGRQMQRNLARFTMAGQPGVPGRRPVPGWPPPAAAVTCWRRCCGYWARI